MTPSSRDVDVRSWRASGNLSEVLSQSDFVSMHAPGRGPRFTQLARRSSRDEAERSLINTGAGATGMRGDDQALQEGWIAHCALDVTGTGAAP